MVVRCREGERFYNPRIPSQYFIGPESLGHDLQKCFSVFFFFPPLM
jgi:hypothetical protein